MDVVEGGFLLVQDPGAWDWQASELRALPEGREALERIANDPILASFYIKAKRNTVPKAIRWIGFGQKIFVFPKSVKRKKRKEEGRRGSGEWRVRLGRQGRG